jgi:hypothetical protein
MKWNIILSTLVVALATCSQSFGFELLDVMLGGCGCGCQTSCCSTNCCKVKCVKEKCCKASCCNNGCKTNKCCAPVGNGCHVAAPSCGVPAPTCGAPAPTCGVAAPTCAAPSGPTCGSDPGCHRPCNACCKPSLLDRLFPCCKKCHGGCLIGGCKTSCCKPAGNGCHVAAPSCGAAAHLRCPAADLCGSAAGLRQRSWPDLADQHRRFADAAGPGC